MLQINQNYNINSLDGLRQIKEVDVVITDPPFPNGRDLFNDTVLDGYFILYYCSKITKKYIVFFWSQINIPKAPHGWYEIARNIWHKPNGQSATWYENVIVWAKEDRTTTNKVWRIPIINYQSLPEWEEHPTQKPIKLMRKIVQQYSKEGELVLDPFSGSGSTLVACKQLNRQYMGFEIEKKYYEITKKRLAQSNLNNIFTV